MKVKEVAKLLGKSEARVRQLIESGDLRAEKKEGVFEVDDACVNAILQQQQKKSARLRGKQEKENKKEGEEKEDGKRDSGEQRKGFFRGKWWF